MKILDNHKYNMYLDQNLNGSRWATEAEMKKVLTKLELDQDCVGGGVPLISDGKTVYVDSLDNHTLIFGSTGSKKTRLFCMPTINILGKTKESFIVTDPKGELYARSSGYLESQGYKIKVLNFRDPASSHCWNPLLLPYRLYKQGDIDQATEMIHDFIFSLEGIVRSDKDPYWSLSAANYIVGCIIVLFELAKCEDEVNMKSVIHLSSFGHNSNNLVFGEFIERINRQSIAYSKLQSVLSNANDTRKGIMGTVDTMLYPFVVQPSLTQMLSKSSFEIQTIGNEKTAVFLIIPDEKTTLHFLAASFIKQSYTLLINEAQLCSKRMLPIRVNYILDEFANMPKIEDMPSMITAARSRNLRFLIVAQSERQLVNIYKEDAHTIKGNCGNWIFLSSRELTLLKEIQTLCGFRNINSKEESLITISQLQMFDKSKGQALILQDRNYPFISYLPDINDYELFNQHDPVPFPKNPLQTVKVFDFIGYLNWCKQVRFNPGELFKGEMIDAVETKIDKVRFTDDFFRYLDDERKPRKGSITSLDDLFKDLDHEEEDNEQEFLDKVLNFDKEEKS